MKIVALLSLLMLTKAADIEINNEATVSPTDILNRLPVEALYSVGSYLSFPNGSLSRVNQKMNESFNSYPLGNYMAERFNIPGLQGLSLKDSEFIQLKRWLGGPCDWKVEFPKLITFCLDRRLSDVHVGDFVLFAFNMLAAVIADSGKLKTFMNRESLDGPTDKFLIEDVCILASRTRHDGLISVILDTFYSIPAENELTEKQIFTRRILQIIELESEDSIDSPFDSLTLKVSCRWVQALLHLCTVKIWSSDKLFDVFNPSPNLKKSSILDVDVSSLTRMEKRRLEAINRVSIKKAENFAIGKLFASLTLFPGPEHENRLNEFLTRDLFKTCDFDYFELYVKFLLKRGSLEMVQTLIESARRHEMFTDPELIELARNEHRIYHVLKKHIPISKRSMADQYQACASLDIVLKHYQAESLTEILIFADIHVHLKLKLAIEFGDGPDVLDIVLSDQESIPTPNGCFEAVQHIFKKHGNSIQLRNWLRALLLNSGCILTPSGPSINLTDYNAEFVFQVLEDNELIMVNLFRRLNFASETKYKLIVAVMHNERYYKLLKRVPSISLWYPLSGLRAFILACKTEKELDRLFEITGNSKKEVFSVFRSILQHSKLERIESLRVMLSYWLRVYPQHFDTKFAYEPWHKLISESK